MRARVVNHPPPDPNHAGESPKPLDPNHAGESHTANSCFMPLANRPPNLFIIKGKKRERERSSPDSSKSGRVSPESLFEGYFGEKNQKWSRATHVTTVLSVNDGLNDRVSILRDFETLGGYIVNF
jgi:hypothetical protein